MLPPLNVLDWLNVFTVSQISPRNQRLVDQILDPNTPDADLDRHIGTLLGLPKSPRENPEILLICGAAEANRGNFPAARSHLQTAIREYIYDRHRRAIGLYLLGWVEWELDSQNPKPAEKNWEKAIDLFTRLGKGDLRLTEWYEERLKEMRNFIEMEKATRLDNVFFWLRSIGDCSIGESAISQQNRLLIDMLHRYLNQHKYDQAKGMIEMLLKVSSQVGDLAENVEILIECSLAYNQFGDWEKALEFMRKAARLCPPLTHGQAVTSWMLGILEWNSKKHRPQAIQDWQKSIQEFKRLALQADYLNNPRRRRAYEDTIKTIEYAYRWMTERSF